MHADDELMDAITALAAIAKEIQPKLLSRSIEAEGLHKKFPHRTENEIAEKIKIHFQGSGLFSND